MELKYVGAMPNVSASGVGFDQTRTDKYLLLDAAVKLMEALSAEGAGTRLDLRNTSAKEYSGGELKTRLETFCTNLDDVVEERDEKAKAFVDDLVERVRENDRINEDERAAWLKNIELMTGHFLQHITNETVYKCTLKRLGEIVHEVRTEEIVFPVYRHFGEVLHDLVRVLERGKPPIDSTLQFASGEGTPMGIFVIKHVKKPKNI